MRANRASQRKWVLGRLKVARMGSTLNCMLRYQAWMPLLARNWLRALTRSVPTPMQRVAISRSGWFLSSSFYEAVQFVVVRGPIVSWASHNHKLDRFVAKSCLSGHAGRLDRIFFLETIRDDLAQAHYRGMNIAEGRVERREHQADIVGWAKIGQHLHIVDERQIYAQTLSMPNRDVGAATMCLARRVQAESQRL